MRVIPHARQVRRVPHTARLVVEEPSSRGGAMRVLAEMGLLLVLGLVLA